MDKYTFDDCNCKIDIVDPTVKACDGLPGLYIDYNNLNKECVKTWDLFAKGKTKGVFQLEKNLGKHWSKLVHPTSVEYISALISIIRPGTLRGLIDGKTIANRYVDRRNNLEEVEYIHPALETLLNTTYGCYIYQEDVLKLAKVLAGFDLVQLNSLRKNIGKKSSSGLKKDRVDFITGCQHVGLLNEEQANQLFDAFEKAGRYLFNKCIDGDTKLLRDVCGRYHPTIAEMYKIKNDKEYAKSVNKISLHKKYKLFGYGTGYSLYQDNRIRKNKVVDIRYQGVKPIYKITLSNGATISTTDNHKYPTKNGEKRLDELKIGDILFVKGEYEKCTQKYGYSDITKENIERKSYQKCGFPTGENNPGYTNGAYAEFKKNKELLPKNCEDCGIIHRRMEVHHVDGDRTNSSMSNLVKLCPSCHKKREYKVGRVKKGEKGYPVLESKIIAIDLIGEKEVYDVEMEAPNHNFLVESGIVTCNSHGVGYGEISYWTAYAKAHFPLHFCCSYLHYAKEKTKPQEEIDEIVLDAKSMNIDVLTPDLNLLFNGDHGDFSLFQGKINFGIRHIKGCGESHIDRLIELTEEGEKTLGKSVKDWNWLELMFVLFLRLNKTVVNGLISVGGVSHLGLSRQKMLHDYNLCSSLDKKDIPIVVENIGSITSIEEAIDLLHKTPKLHKARIQKYNEIKLGMTNTPFATDDPPQWVAEKEEYYLGVSLSCLKCDTVDTIGNTLCKEFQNGKAEKNMSVVGEIKSIRQFLIKNGNLAGQKMCFGTIEDNSGRIDFSLSPKEYELYMNDLFKGNIVMLTGRRGRNNNFQAQKVRSV